LEQILDHSKAKLALAILTSPAAAFEEILRRKLLGTAMAIVGITGVLSMVVAVGHGINYGPLHFFEIGKSNPLTWFGLYLLYALALQKLLKWIGTEVSYADVLTVMGWSQVCLLLMQVAAVVSENPAVSNMPGGNLQQGLLALVLVLQVGYVAIIAVGLQAACRIPFARGIMGYSVVAIAAMIACGITYSRSRTEVFLSAPDELQQAVRSVVGADATPWVGAAALGLILGGWYLAEVFGWDKRTRTIRTATLGLIGLAAFGVYFGVMRHTDYYGAIFGIQRDYELDKFDDAARRMRSIRHMSTMGVPGFTTEAYLTLGVADTYLLANKPGRAISYYHKYEKLAAEAKLDKPQAGVLARIHAGIGCAYEMQGRTGEAIEQFKAAAKAFPESRDPWVRLAVAYDRIGNYPEAIKAADHALVKQKSEAVVAWVALAQAALHTGDAKRAKEAMDKVKEIDDELAEKIGSKPEDWKNAVSKLAPIDLKFPLEKDPVVPQERPKPGAKKK